MKYRIFEQNGRFCVQRKRLFRWVWWCGCVFKWSNTWAAESTYNIERFSNINQALDFIAKEKGLPPKRTLITSENIQEYTKRDDIVCLND